MYNLPDHPAIAHAMCYGYDRPQQIPECRICGATAQCWGEDSGYLCFDCARDEFRHLSDIEAVEALGFEVLYD